MVRAVRAVLHQVRHQHHQEELQHEGQPRDEPAHAVVGGPAEAIVHHAVGDEQHEAHDQVVEEEVRQVVLPLGAEHRLIPAQRAHLLDEHEHQRGPEQVQDQEVEPEIRRVVGEVRDGRGGPAQQLRHHQDQERPRRQPARAPEDAVHDGDGPRDDHAARHEVAQGGHVVDGAELGRGQVRREVKTDDAEQAHDRQREAHHAGQEPASGGERAVRRSQAAEARQLGPFVTRLCSGRAVTLLGHRVRLSRRRPAASGCTRTLRACPSGTALPRRPPPCRR